MSLLPIFRNTFNVKFYKNFLLTGNLHVVGNKSTLVTNFGDIKNSTMRCDIRGGSWYSSATIEGVFDIIYCEDFCIDKDLEPCIPMEINNRSGIIISSGDEQRYYPTMFQNRLDNRYNPEIDGIIQSLDFDDNSAQVKVVYKGNINDEKTHFVQGKDISVIRCINKEAKILLGQPRDVDLNIDGLWLDDMFFPE